MKYQGKHCRRGLGGKAVTAMLALTLVLAAYWAVGGTAAWLAAKSDPIASTFTFGDINITLKDEDPQEGPTKIIPGMDIKKALKVTVQADSVDCWLFVKVEQTGTFVDGKVTYAIVDGWTKGDGSTIPENVYYRQVNGATADMEFSVLNLLLRQQGADEGGDSEHHNPANPDLHGLRGSEGRHQHGGRCLGSGRTLNIHLYAKTKPIPNMNKEYGAL